MRWSEVGYRREKKAERGAQHELSASDPIAPSRVMLACGEASSRSRSPVDLAAVRSSRWRHLSGAFCSTVIAHGMRTVPLCSVGVLVVSDTPEWRHVRWRDWAANGRNSGQNSGCTASARRTQRGDSSLLSPALYLCVAAPPLLPSLERAAAEGADCRSHCCHNHRSDE